jgi:unsaturated rhamnogalacturonyl hydrolase
MKILWVLHPTIKFIRMKEINIDLSSKFKTIVLMVIVAFVCAGCSRIQHKQWSVAMAQSEMKRTPDAWKLDFSKKLKWNYCQGVIGKSFLDLYDRYQLDECRNYVMRYADTMIFENGQIYGYKADEYSLDRLYNGNILFRIYQYKKNEKYRLALDLLRSQLNSQPRNSERGFWHQQIYPNQMWLDDLYMQAPFYAQYSKLTNDSLAFEDIAQQFLLIRKHLYDSKTGLYRHGWDESKQQMWCDSETGQSPVIWSQGVGWYAMALVDALEYFPTDHPRRHDLIAILHDLATAIKNVQEPLTGLWYQLPDQPKHDGNYFEATGSCMFVYALLKGVRLGYLDQAFFVDAKKGYNGIISQFIKTNHDGTISIIDGCIGAGLGGKPYRDGSYNYYISEPKRENDPKAVGVFIMASLEFEKINP